MRTVTAPRFQHTISRTLVNLVSKPNPRASHSYQTMFSIRDFRQNLSHPHDKTNKMTAPSEDSDQTGHQPGHAPSLISVRCAKDPGFLHADSEDSDQTERMPTLI